MKDTMILLQYPPAFGLSSLSPFCIKVEAYLKLCSLDYKTKFTSNPRRGPYGKMPVLLHKGEMIADSRCIVDYINSICTSACDSALNQEQKAIGHALQRTFEEHLYFAIMFNRWVDPNGFAACEKAFKKLFPMKMGKLALHFLRRRLTRQCMEQGIAKLERDTIYKLACLDIDSFECLLKGPFLFGAQATSYDASIFSFLMTIRSFPSESPLKDRVKNPTVTRFLEDFEKACPLFSS